MREILHAKADFCEEFKSALLDTAGRRLVEAVTGDDFCSSGLPPYLACSIYKSPTFSWIQPAGSSTRKY